MGQRFRGSLAVTQLAFSVVLLIGAVLLVRTFIELRRIDLGFTASHALTMRTVGATRLLPLSGTIGDWSITLEQVTGDALSQARFTALLLGLFAALALTLATIGVYGVISLLVARRRREIGIRLALGARPAWILGMVVGRGMTLTAFGVITGVVAAAALTRVVANLLYGVTRLDPLTFAAVPVALTSVALLACVIPARRAARVSPNRRFREE
jgi:ABC-type antimicrobial peptide transport system permease subunit